MSRVLVVEDEVVLRSEVRRLLTRAGYDVSEAGSMGEVEEYNLEDFDLVLTDLRLPGGSGMDLLARDVATPVIVMTSFATVKSAVEAMKQGASDYISKPFDPDELLLQVKRVLDEQKLIRKTRTLKRDVDQVWTVDGLIGHCEAMQKVLRRIARVAVTESTVLILGESGTGKELVARALHEQSPRVDGPFVAVNCAAIPDNLIESELFGHEKGAFTGAVARHTGLVEAAHGGTLFLDEVGELPAPAQARLLRVLQEQEIRHVGSSKTRRVNVRVLAATHRDLPAMIAQGTFREDLYYRLRVVDVTLPPLRERGEDVAELAEFFLSKACCKLGRSKLEFGDDAMAAMMDHPWPGNVRELENAIERAVILCEEPEISADMLGLQLRSGNGADPTPESTDADEGTLVDYFRQFVLKHQAELSETEIAKRLGISRKALWERRRRHGLVRPKNRG